MSQAAEAAGVKPVRRIVTANKDGRSYIAEDTTSPFVMPTSEVRGLAVTELWLTNTLPPKADAPDLCKVPIDLEPAGGTVFRIVEFPPDDTWVGKVDYKAMFAIMGESAVEALERGLASGEMRHPLMHATKTIDYAIVLEGECWAMMDDGETLMRPGDVLIQRATNHAWSNRSGKPCRVAFVLMEAK